MKMVTKAAAANFKYNKSRNFLVGTAICMTTLLLFLVPAVAFHMIGLEREAVRQMYPMWHAVLRNVDSDVAEKFSMRANVEETGLRCDVGEVPAEKSRISMIAVDDACAKMNRIELEKGRMPRNANEIVVSEGMLAAIGQPEKEIGDEIHLPYQPYKDGGLDYRKEGEFVICGMTKDSEEALKQQLYMACVSLDFAKEEFAEEELRYYAYFQVKQGNAGLLSGYDAIIESIEETATGLGIDENGYGMNEDYIMANEIDPSMLPIMSVILLLIVAAGVITIYSIYYVSMTHRVRDFGKLKAIGATTHQVRQIVFREGFYTALCAVPAGLVIGTLLLKPIIGEIVKAADGLGTQEVEVIRNLLKTGEYQLYQFWLYPAAAVITFLTVYLSIRKPMKMAGKITPVEAMRFHGEPGKHTKRKGYASLNLWRITKINLARNKKRTAITVLAMGVTGVLFMTVATVLACADPKEIANASMEGEYQLSVITESGNKEHPEREWTAMQANNPLDSAFREEIEALPGVEKTEYWGMIRFTCDDFVDSDGGTVAGVPERLMKMLKKGILEGTFDEEAFRRGEKMLVSEYVRQWEPGLEVGETYMLKFEYGDEIIEKEIEIMGFVDLPSGALEYGSFFMPYEALGQLTKEADAGLEKPKYNLNNGLIIFGEKKYDAQVEEKLRDICEKDGRIELLLWQKEFQMWSQVMGLMRMGCYAFLGVLGIICIMNLINTIINSIYMRRKEIGMMQAIGLSEKQLMKMLQIEGLFYTAGALILSIGLGSALGYVAFFAAKKEHMMNIQYYHYPVGAAAAMIVIVLVVEMILILVISRSLRKQSLIDRIRFSE